MIRDELAKRLKYYREQNNLTVYQVGDAIGKSGKTVSAWETGRGQPDADMLVTLCLLYKIQSIGDLYGEINEYTDTEKEVIKQYRDNPDLHKAVHLILGIDKQKESQ